MSALLNILRINLLLSNLFRSKFSLFPLHYIILKFINLKDQFTAVCSYLICIWSYELLFTYLMHASISLS